MKPFEECPQFNTCSCNVCPLDPDMDEKFTLPGEEKCKAHKPTRLKIGTKYGLPKKGLRGREFSGKQRWEGLSPEKKALLVEQGLKSLKSIKKG